MKFWYAVIGTLVAIAAVILVGTPEPQPTISTDKVDAPADMPEIVVVDENGREVNAEIWKEGTAWCARAEGYLPSCAHEKEKRITITLYKDPGAETVEVSVIHCAFFAYGPAGAPILGPEKCGNVRLKRGRYSFVLFDGNGSIVGEYNVLVVGGETIKGKGAGKGAPATVRFYDAETKKAAEGWLTVGHFSLKGSKTTIALDDCITAFGWGRGYKKRDFWACPDKNLDVYLPKQLGGGRLVVSAPGADRIVVTDRGGTVLDSIEGEEAVLESVPPGAYVIHAINGASVTTRQVDVIEGQNVVSISPEPGRALLITRKRVEVYAMGKKVVEGKGRLVVPARTVLQILVLDETPQKKVVVLLPGEIRVI